MTSGPIDTLMDEHRRIEGVLDALDAFVRAPALAAPEARSRLRDFAEFFRTFADRAHHGKEEDILFRELGRCGMPADRGPVAVMREEHETGRELVRALALAAVGEGAWSPSERETVRDTALGFSGFLRDHIRKEDLVLYPMAARVLSPESLDAMSERFAAFERETMGGGARERIHALASHLTEGAVR